MTLPTTSAIRRLMALGALFAARGALADVTMQEQMSLDASILKAHTTETSYYSGEKKRHEYLFACDGFMKLFCSKQRTLDIVRVDQGVIWNIEEKQHRYSESGLISPEQWQTAVKQQQAAYEKLRSCPALHDAAPDTSKCQLSEPQITVNKTGDHTTLLGHDAQRTDINMTQSCKMQTTGEECQLAYEFNVWLTQDEIPGLADRRAFEQAYLKKQGMNADMLTNPTMARAMAPYAESFRKLSAKSADLQGFPLRTRFRFAYGGAHCRLGGAPEGSSAPTLVGTAGTSARYSAENSTANAAGWSAAEGAERSTGSSGAGYIAGSTAGAFARSLVGGMFARHQAGDTGPATGSTDSTVAGPGGQPLKTFAEMEVQVVSIDAAPIAPVRFELPSGYQKLAPVLDKPAETPSCPSS